MKHMPKNSMCIFLSLLMAFSLSACSAGTELNEQNINWTVAKVEKALKDFDEKDLKKYVESDTLSKILAVSNGKEQFEELGEAIFDELSIKVQSINLEEATVTVSVENRDLYQIAADFAQKLSNNYTEFQLLGMLNDEDFLNNNLSQLTEQIEAAPMQQKPQTVTLSVKKGAKNLVLVFDEESENAVSGGALGAIMKTFSASL
ncbi:MAG: hypothetical protein IJR70_07490 [Eubacterium sp.]|nr:hypothetical protein [Eubacterium sp.]